MRHNGFSMWCYGALWSFYRALWGIMGSLWGAKGRYGLSMGRSGFSLGRYGALWVLYGALWGAVGHLDVGGVLQHGLARRQLRLRHRKVALGRRRRHRGHLALVVQLEGALPVRSPAPSGRKPHPLSTLLLEVRPDWL